MGENVFFYFVGALMTGAGMAGLMYYASGEDPYVDLKAMVSLLV